MCSPILTPKPQERSTPRYERRNKAVRKPRKKKLPLVIVHTRKRDIHFLVDIPEEVLSDDSKLEVYVDNMTKVFKPISVDVHLDE